jgi:hypothetical protein
LQKKIRDCPCVSGRTISIEVGKQNSGLGAALAKNNFTSATGHDDVCHLGGVPLRDRPPAGGNLALASAEVATGKAAYFFVAQ